MDILTSKSNGILTIEFNRPERKNAITAVMYQIMADALKDAENDATTRAIMIIGKPAIFTAGNDLEDFMKSAKPAPDQAFENKSAFQFMRHLSQASKPVVAAVSGAAIGIGTTLLMHCDLVYAADNATFSMPFTPLGLCPEFASSLLLPRLIGYQRAAEKLLLGEAFSAQEAYEMGMINKVCRTEELLQFATTQAAKLVALPAASIRVTKRLMKSSQADPILTAMAAENQQFSEMLLAPEAREALKAFFEKRLPDFTQFK